MVWMQAFTIDSHHAKRKFNDSKSINDPSLWRSTLGTQLQKSNADDADWMKEKQKRSRHSLKFPFFHVQVMQGTTSAFQPFGSFDHGWQDKRNLQAFGFKSLLSYPSCYGWNNISAAFGYIL
jgi:hypothetical protein